MEHLFGKANEIKWMYTPRRACTMESGAAKNQSCPIPSLEASRLQSSSSPPLHPWIGGPSIHCCCWIDAGIASRIGRRYLTWLARSPDGLAAACCIRPIHTIRRMGMYHHAIHLLHWVSLLVGPSA